MYCFLRQLTDEGVVFSAFAKVVLNVANNVYTFKLFITLHAFIFHTESRSTSYTMLLNLK